MHLVQLPYHRISPALRRRKVLKNVKKNVSAASASRMDGEIV
jgi:hypothetical protein